ncbi:MAG: AmmeMemoRadiSam system protein B, partial [Spirochaetota bacterium]|nr:AmmeMemoRadiSam system protein B [Spirochaetota bacterium]
YGDIEYTELVDLIKKAFRDEENLVVISTDLSHFHTLDEANKYDNICLKAVKEMNPPELDSGCEACGIIGLKAVLESAEQLDLKSEIVDYRTSYDASSDASRVVGYMSALFF